ncbi:UNVERIFIED_CONTAM: hypothetical protein NCL1_21718 [Trichonephila clavipes]
MKEGWIASSYECPQCNERMGLYERKIVILDGIEKKIFSLRIHLIMLYSLAAVVVFDWRHLVLAWLGAFFCLSPRVWALIGFNLIGDGPRNSELYSILIWYPTLITSTSRRNLGYGIFNLQRPSMLSVVRTRQHRP